MSQNNTGEEFIDLHYEDEQLLMQVQALVDNELDENQIPDIIEKIEGNYRLREEYIGLLRLKRTLGGLPRIKPRVEWYENFEKKRRFKIPMFAGSILTIFYIVWSLFFFSAEILEYMVPKWFNIVGIGSLTGGLVFFLINTLMQKKTEDRNERSYKDVIR